MAFDLADLLPDPHGAGRRHRFMESADFNAAFREFFAPLRANIRRGMSCDGQLYALEMDACIPGELLGTEWIPPASRGVIDARELADAGLRRAVLRALLAERRVEAMFAYLCEIGRANDPGDAADPPRLLLEIASADAIHAVEFPIRPGRGHHARELLRAEPRRIGPMVAA